MLDKIRWGDNPHPFSWMKTELIREGKYDEYGNRRTVDIAGCAMPLQEIEFKLTRRLTWTRILEKEGNETETDGK